MKGTTMNASTCTFCGNWKSVFDPCCTVCKSDTAQGVYNRMVSRRIGVLAANPRPPLTADEIIRRSREAERRQAVMAEVSRIANAALAADLGRRVVAWIHADCEPVQDFLAEMEA
jgi:hypothetical protein